MSARQVIFSSLAKRAHLQDVTQIDIKAARLYEAKAIISVCELARVHNVHQIALSAATALNDVVRLCEDAGLDISAAATLQTATVLWDQKEIMPSITMLQELAKTGLSLATQDISVATADLLAHLVSRNSEYYSIDR